MEPPAKRQRKDSAPNDLPDMQSLDFHPSSQAQASRPPSGASVSASSSHPTKPLSTTMTIPHAQRLTSLPAPHLLLSLPSLLMHPPTHHLHPTSLMLSLRSIKKLLSSAQEPSSSSLTLNPDVECRAWVSWAEIGMCVIDGGWYEVEECKEWAGGIVGEVCLC